MCVIVLLLFARDNGSENTEKEPSTRRYLKEVTEG